MENTTIIIIVCFLSCCIISSVVGILLTRPTPQPTKKKEQEKKEQEKKEEKKKEEEKKEEPPKTEPPKTEPAADPEVFGTVGYNYTSDQAENACGKYDSRLATKQELENAQKKGADWCSTGWVKNEQNAMYPITTRLIGGCGNGSPGIKTYTPPEKKAAVNCFGIKPKTSTEIHPFNEFQWSEKSAGPNYFLHGPAIDWHKSFKKVDKITKVGSENVYLINHDGYAKMVSDSGVSKYYVGSIQDFDATKWDTYNVGSSGAYILRVCPANCNEGCDSNKICSNSP
jgi:hypothetical protein